MATLQEYLDNKYPIQEEKEQVKEIIIDGTNSNFNSQNTLKEEETKELDGGELNLSEYPNLEVVVIDGDCLKSRLTSLNISNCSKIVILGVSRNQLTHLDLKNCSDLKELYCGKNILTKLILNPQAELEELYIDDNNLSEQDLNVSLTPQDSFYVSWLKNSKQLTPEQVLGNEQQLREEYNKSPQSWLDQNYPDKKAYIYDMYINQQLEETLDCSGYDNLRKISISTQVDSSKFEIKGGSYENWNGKKYETQETKIIPCIPAQEYLDKEYPKEKREEIKELRMDNKGLEGNLDLPDFTNLEEL
ncbi:27847_t:CDS:2 [Gigaspora margarita]|uniref:27847_t:CDS:1 n=1 Tax=Gigaspora margarita TaxID=4874 RepID=A0ABN7UHU0_GIGMA|nr:27847_t:CDS:2 [Gigaspora margarita]